MRTPTTPGQADGSNVHTVRNGIPDTTPCLWYQLQTPTTGIVHMSTCATPASWHHMMINFYTQANGYAPKRPPRSSTSHSLPFHKGLQTWHRPETDQQSSSHLTERTTKNIGNHIIGQLPSLPRPHKRGTDSLSMRGTPTNNAGSGHPSPTRIVTTMTHPTHSTLPLWPRFPAKHGTHACSTANSNLPNALGWQFTNNSVNKHVARTLTPATLTYAQLRANSSCSYHSGPPTQCTTWTHNRENNSWQHFHNGTKHRRNKPSQGKTPSATTLRAKPTRIISNNFGMRSHQHFTIIFFAGAHCAS